VFDALDPNENDYLVLFALCLLFAIQQNSGKLDRLATETFFYFLQKRCRKTLRSHLIHSLLHLKITALVIRTRSIALLAFPIPAFDNFPDAFIRAAQAR
jgi:hypothetical protein